MGMIEFKCSRCGEMLSTPESMAGEVESCPACKARNEVPSARTEGQKDDSQSLLKDILEAFFGTRKTHAEVALEDDPLPLQTPSTPSEPSTLQAERKPPVAGLFIGGLLMFAGVMTTVSALNMNVSKSIEHGIEIANLELLNQRTGMIVIGCSLFLSGMLSGCLSAIHSTLWQIGHNNSKRRE
jgi:hypothetical protein